MNFLEHNKRVKTSLIDQKIDSSGTIDSAILSSKLNKLSLEERSQGLHDLHGVADLPKEDPKTIASKVAEMTSALSATRATGGSDTSPYDKALERDPKYVESLKVPCLRVTNYDTRDAVALLRRFLSQKLNLFGEEKLTREIHLDDLNEQEQQAVHAGIVQMLPHRDRSGRAVLLNIGKLNQKYGSEVVLRANFYMAMVAFREEENQMRGLVCVYFGFGQTATPAKRTLAYYHLWRSLPIRVAATHICRHDDANGNFMKVSVRFISAAIEAHRLCRWRNHVGTVVECMYQLMTFGIVKDALPMTNGGQDIDLTNHRQMLAAIVCREKELKHKLEDPGKPGDDRENRGLILVPGPLDVLMGRGRHPKSLPGALKLHNMILERFDAYNASSKFEKTVLAEVVLKQVKESGGRFLREVPGGYEECDDAEARRKVSHGFRNVRIGNRSQGGSNKAQKRSLEG